MRGAGRGHLNAPKGAPLPLQPKPFLPSLQGGGVQEDEEHMLWKRAAWKHAHEPFVMEVLVLETTLCMRPPELL